MVSSRSDLAIRQPRARQTLVLFDSVSLLVESLVCALHSADGSIRFECHEDALVRLSDAAKPAASMVILCPQQQAAFSLANRVSRLRDAHPSVSFAIFSQVDDVDEIGQALALGASGVISTDLTLPVVLSAIRLMLSGGCYVPALRLLSSYAPSAGRTVEERPWQGGLSAREASVARALKSGTPNKVIAAELGIGESAVKLLVRRLMRKLKAKNRTEVAYLMNDYDLG